MDLIRCPACHNQIAAHSLACPVCGCNPKRRRITRVLKWSLALLVCGWAAEHIIVRKLASHHSSTHQIDSRHHA